MSILLNLLELKKLLPSHVTLVAVSKTHSPEKITEAYNTGQRIFGENKVQELVSKYEQLPKDIEWHLIGHLQTNKVKLIAPFVSLIHSVDSIKLLSEINKEAIKNNRVINCLLQARIAKEETKFGMTFNEIEALLHSSQLNEMENIKIIGLMGMATNTENLSQIKSEFKSLHTFFLNLTSYISSLKFLSMGMSSDYKLAIEEGSNMIRVGSSIFGGRLTPTKVD